MGKVKKQATTSRHAGIKSKPKDSKNAKHSILLSKTTNSGIEDLSLKTDGQKQFKNKKSTVSPTFPVEKKAEISRKSGKIKKLAKKDKQKLKKEKVLQKIELTKEAFVNEKEKQKREKTVVVKDMRPLMDALPSLDSLLQFKRSGDIKTGVPLFDLSKREKRNSQKLQKQSALQQKLDTYKNLITDLSKMSPEERRKAIREATLKRKRDMGLLNDDNIGNTME